MSDTFPNLGFALRQCSSKCQKFDGVRSAIFTWTCTWSDFSAAAVDNDDDTSLPETFCACSRFTNITSSSVRKCFSENSET